MSMTELIKQLREETSCGVIDCKKALEQAQGDLNKAREILAQQGRQIAAQKSDRQTLQGRVEAYVHTGNKLAVLVEVNCETDFVARNEDFVAFCRDVAMHIAAMNPLTIERESGETLSDKQEPTALLDQPFVKDPKQTVGERLTALIAKTGENIRIRRFVRYQVGQE